MKLFKWDRLTVAEAKQQNIADAKAARIARKKQSYRLRYTGPSHQTAGVNIHLVPLLDKPLFPWAPPVVGKDECPTCNIIHPVKTLHLWLDSTRTVLVSQGVYDLLVKAGLALCDLELVGNITDPPPLTLNGKTNRRQVDQTNERIQTAWGSPNGETPAIQEIRNG